MKLHHVGMVVPSIEDHLPHYVDTLGLKAVTGIVEDPAQKARLILLSDGQGGSFIELIEPTTDDSPVARQAAAGGGFAHLCYETRDLAGEIKRLRSSGALLIRPPTPAPLFDNRPVAFLYLRATQSVLELVEIDEDA